MQPNFNAIRIIIILLNHPLKLVLKLKFSHLFSFNLKLVLKLSHLFSIKLGIYTKRFYYSNISIAENISAVSNGKTGIIQTVLLEAIVKTSLMQETLRVKSPQGFITKVNPNLSTLFMCCLGVSSANATANAGARSRIAMKGKAHDNSIVSSSLFNVQGDSQSHSLFSLTHG